MPFGLCGAPSFMRLMNEGVRGLTNILVHLEQRFAIFYSGGPVVFYKKIHGPVRKIYLNKAAIDIYRPPSVVSSCFPLELRTH